MGTYAILLLIFVTMFSGLGTEFFAFKVKIDSQGLPNAEEGVSPDSNFYNSLEAFLSVFIVLINDGWSTIFFQHAKANPTTNYMSYIYFVTLLIAGQFIMLNLFLAILLNNFEEDSREEQKKI
jgi:hypothetical protein